MNNKLKYGINENIQIGGNYDELKDYILVYQLLNEIYPKKISYTDYADDPFFDLTKNNYLNNLLKWYKSKNPNFEFMYIINPDMPEYKYIIANILKDLYLLFTTTKLPRITENNIIRMREKTTEEQWYKLNRYNELIDEKDTKYNKDNLLTYFKQIENILQNNYKYNDVINIIYSYLFYFNPYSENIIIGDCSPINLFKQSQYILFPTFKLIDFYKVNLLFTAPVINFYIKNNSHSVHSYIVDPCYEIYHDLFFHATNINIKLFYQSLVNEFALRI